MKNLVILAILVAGGWYWYKHRAPEVIVDEEGNPVIAVFTINGCGAPCQGTLDMLDARGAPYIEKEIDPGDSSNPDVKYWRSVSGKAFPVTVYSGQSVTGSSKWEMISLLGNGFGDAYLFPSEKRYFSRHVDASGQPQIVLYGTDWCPSCAAMRTAFTENGVSFIDINVETSGELEQMTQVMEIPGYPAVWVGYTRVHGTTYDAVMAVANSVMKGKL